MLNLIPVEYSNQRILTTEQLAEFYETDVNNIKKNFSNNKSRFAEGVHYYCLKGEVLKAFKRQVNDIDMPLVNKFASTLYLWTERGASRHCKILDTDKAWEQFDVLEANYFRAKTTSIKMLNFNGTPCTSVKNITKKHKCSDETVQEYLKRLYLGRDYAYLMAEDLRILKEDNKLDPHISSMYIIYPSGIEKIERYLRMSTNQLGNSKIIALA